MRWIDIVSVITLLLVSCTKEATNDTREEQAVTIIGQEADAISMEAFFSPPAPPKPVPAAKAHLDPVGKLKPDGNATLLGFPLPKGLGYVKQSEVMVVMAMGTSLTRVQQFYQDRKFSVLIEKTGLRIEHNLVTKEKLLVKGYADASLIVRPWKNRLTKFIFLIPPEAGPVGPLSDKVDKAKGPQKIIVKKKPPASKGTKGAESTSIPKGAESVGKEIEAWKKAHPGEEFVD